MVHSAQLGGKPAAKAWELMGGKLLGAYFVMTNKPQQAWYFAL
jgi:hypothetical protein